MVCTEKDPIRRVRKMTKENPGEIALEKNKQGNKNKIDPALRKEWREASEALGLGN